MAAQAGGSPGVTADMLAKCMRPTAVSAEGRPVARRRGRDAALLVIVDSRTASPKDDIARKLARLLNGSAPPARTEHRQETSIEPDPEHPSRYAVLTCQSCSHPSGPPCVGRST